LATLVLVRDVENSEPNRYYTKPKDQAARAATLNGTPVQE
jgi:hypothetical protein